MKKDNVRLAVIGLGNMGSAHARALLEGRIPGATLAAVCDIDPQRLLPFPTATGFTDSNRLLASSAIDAVIIATPHYSHTTIGVAALKAGRHVLVEKPISVHKADCLRLIGAHRNKKQVFAAMFNQRTDLYYQKVRELVTGGELGAIRRINWIITDWFRPEAYYASGGWRATWAGEGGGVLLNQCPHNLDLFQWIFGMPAKVRGFCQFGRYHNIEVEDDVTAYFEYPDGKTAVFITSTGEAPGTNRLEITAEQGRLVLENNRLDYTRNEVPTATFSRTTTGHFSRPEVWQVAIPLPTHRGEQHLGILKNFVAAIGKGEKLIAPAAEGLHSVELANAILMSSLQGRTVEMPLSAPAFARTLQRQIDGSTFKKKVVSRRGPATDFAKSF